MIFDFKDHVKSLNFSYILMFKISNIKTFKFCLWLVQHIYLQHFFCYTFWMTYLIFFHFTSDSLLSCSPFSSVSLSFCAFHSHSVSLMFFLHFSHVHPRSSLPLRLLYFLYIPHKPFKDDLQVKPCMQRQRSWQRLALSGDSTQLYFEIHHVSSCGLSRGTGIVGWRLSGEAWRCSRLHMMSSCLP